MALLSSFPGSPLKSSFEASALKSSRGRGNPGPCWISVNMPHTGAPAFPNLGAATFVWDAGAGVGHYDYAGTAVTFDGLNILGGSSLRGIGEIESLNDLINCGDLRSARRYLKVTITVETSPLPAFGGPAPWDDPDLPDFGWLSNRTWKWIFWYERHDPRIRQIEVRATLDGDPGWDNEVVYTWQLNADGTATETNPKGLERGTWEAELNNKAVEESNIEALLSSGADPDASATMTFTEVAESPNWYSKAEYVATTTYGLGDNTFFTNLTVLKEVPDGYFVPPAEYALSLSPIVQQAQTKLGEYDLRNLATGYPFHSEPHGEPKTVVFRSGHHYYIFPFFKVDEESGLTTTEMLWECREPRWQWWDGVDEISGLPITIDDGIWHAGWPAGGRQQLCLTQYTISGYDPTEISPLISRDLMRVGCVRRRPGPPFAGGIFTGTPAVTAPDGVRFGYPVTAGPNDWPWLNDPLWTSGGSSLASFADYLELSKGVFVEGTESGVVLHRQGFNDLDTALVSEDAGLGRSRQSWTVDDGTEPTLDATDTNCLDHWGTGKKLIDQDVLRTGGISTPYWPPFFGVAIAYRAQQTGYKVAALNHAQVENIEGGATERSAGDWWPAGLDYP